MPNLRFQDLSSSEDALGSTVTGGVDLPHSFVKKCCRKRLLVWPRFQTFHQDCPETGNILRRRQCSHQHLAGLFFAAARRRRGAAGGAMPKRRRRAADADGQDIAEAIADHKTGRRWAALALCDVAGWPVEKIRRKIPQVCERSLKRWRSALTTRKDVTDAPPQKPRATTIKQADLDLIKKVIVEPTATGKRKRSLVRALPIAISRGASPATYEAYRKRLRGDDDPWDAQEPRRVEAHTPAHLLARKRHCSQHGRTIAHTCAPHTSRGAATRALIEQHARLLEPWPARSPDLSPIEKAWARCKQHLWTAEHLQWHNLQGCSPTGVG